MSGTSIEPPPTLDMENEDPEKRRVSSSDLSNSCSGSGGRPLTFTSEWFSSAGRRLSGNVPKSVSKLE